MSCAGTRRYSLSKVDLEKERRKFDREHTFFHFKRARKILTKCLRSAKEYNDSFFIYYFLAQESILNEEFNEAIELLDKALSIRENDGCTYNDKAICLAEIERYDEALDCFNQGLSRDKNCASLYHNKGWLLNCLHRYSRGQ